jgi:hypothetical protein
VLDVLGLHTARALSTSSKQWLEHGVTWDVTVACVGSRARLGVRSKSAPRRPLHHSVPRFGEGAARHDVAAAELRAAEVGAVDEEMGREADGRGTRSGGWTATSRRREWRRAGGRKGKGVPANARTG